MRMVPAEEDAIPQQMILILQTPDSPLKLMDLPSLINHMVAQPGEHASDHQKTSTDSSRDDMQAPSLHGTSTS
jgi:hypothetical protein